MSDRKVNETFWKCCKNAKETDSVRMECKYSCSSKIPLAQWAELKRKKNRSIKSNVSSNVSVQQKNDPVDPGGTSNISEECQAHRKSSLNEPSQSEKQTVLEYKVSPTKYITNESTAACHNSMSVMESPVQHVSDKHSDLLTDNSTQKNLSQLENKSSVASFILQKSVDESEISSGSDNSTVTGTSSNSSKSYSTPETETAQQFFPPPLESDLPTSHSCLKAQNDNRPDEEKLFESIPAEEKEKDVLVEEILVSKDSILGNVPSISEAELESNPEIKSCDILVEKSKTPMIMDGAIKDKSYFLSEDVKDLLPNLIDLEVDDEFSSFLNADDSELSSVFDHYQIKIKKYQEAIQNRDSIISKLSSKLESTMNANHGQVERLKEDTNLLQLKMKEMSAQWEKQKLKNGNVEYEVCASQTDSVQLSKYDTGIQVETSISSLLQNCNLDEMSFFELFVNKFATDSNSLQLMMKKLNEYLTTHFSHVHIQEFTTLPKHDISSQSNFSEITTVTSENDEQSYEKVDSATVLKKLSSLNMVAKLIESLINISSSGANDSFSDFSPSKFQSFFLRRLQSIESGDIQPDISESESISDINYAEVETPVSKPMVDSRLSVEKLRLKNISEDFSLVTDFLQDEMERLCSYIPSISSEPQGDGSDSCEKEKAEILPGVVESSTETDHQKILLHKSKLETRLKNLKLMDKELYNIQQFPHQSSMDSETMTMSDDNLLMEELPLSRISLLSVTDSEYMGDNIPTDSETNFSRKVSLDMTRSMQEREFCIRCERNVDLLKEKYENDIMNLKDQLEKSFNSQKKNLLESIKNLEAEVTQLKTEKDSLKFELNRQIQSVCSENTLKLNHLSEEYNKELSELKGSQNKLLVERDELEIKLKELQEKLTFSDRKFRDMLDEKANNEINLQNQIADLIQEHQQDLEMIRLDGEAKLNLETKHSENNHKASIEKMQKVYEEEMNSLRGQINQIKIEYEEKEENLLNEHSKTISMIEAAHCDQSAVYQKKIEQLLEEKCELLTKTTEEYETILNKNHRALEILCKRLLAKIKTEKERILNESSKSVADLDISLSAFEQLNNSLENGLVKFLNQNYFMNASSEDFFPDETEYLPIEMSFPIAEEDILPKSAMKGNMNANKNENEKNRSRSSLESLTEPRAVPSESSLDSDDIFTIHTEINRLQEEFQKDVAFYKDINDQQHLQIKSLRQQNRELEDQKENLEIQLQNKDKELTDKESLLTTMDTAAVNQAAQTNSRLLHVLSDLVKTFLDIEHDINTYLHQYGLIPPRSGTLNQNDDDTGQSIGSREDFTSLSLGECPNLELTEDGPDLTPRACDVFLPGGNYDTDLEGEDVVLGASRRLRMAVELVLNLLGRALENQQSQDLKLLLKRNEELSHELQEESQGRDAVNMELVTAESTVRKLESEKQRLEDLSRDMKDDFERLKRELSIERSKVSHLQQEKDSAFDEIHTLKEQCELLASRLGDPGKTESDKMLNSSGTCLHENSELLEENSRLSSEKHTVQKNLSKERQSFLDRLHQMEIALEELNAEKDDLVEKKCKEIRDLKGEMDAMEKQLQSNRKFIEQQALEREQEREEFMIKINKMEEFVKEKERIQSTESQMTREIESLEELLRARIEDHKNAMAKKDEVEKELRHSVDKIRDLREVIDELEKQLDLKCRLEMELRQKLSNICESSPNHDKSNSLSDSADSSRHMQQNKDSMEQLCNLKEKISSQSQEIEMMSQNQTLLHELRGQIHFLEAKVEQRARLLESSFLSAASSPVQSGATSPSGSQDSESLQIPCEDGWEMSPRSIHWLEVKRLEEKIGRLVHLDEELVKKNKELEQQLKKIKASYSECQHENTALQEKLSEQLMQISALKSHIDEQKHRCSTPQKSHPFAEKIEELQENLEKQIENKERLISDLKEAKSTVSALQEEICKKEEMIAIFQKCSEDRHKLNTSDSEDTESLKTELAEKVMLVEVTEKENEDLRTDLEYVKTENASLKDLLKKSEEEIETERTKIEALCDEIANLVENNKRLEHDFNTVQDMMQKKETELATLHEETEDQMKLQAEIDSLEKKLFDQQNVESELREEVEELQNHSSLLKSFKEEIESKDLYIQTLLENHGKELDNLNKQISVLKNVSTGTENNADLQELVKMIMETADAFSTGEATTLQQALINLLKNYMESILTHVDQKHKEHVASVNKSWQEKINEEITNKQNFFETETERLQKTFLFEKEKIQTEKDSFWEQKVKEIEFMLKSEEDKCKKLAYNAKSTRKELEAMYTDEFTSLRKNLDIACKEKRALQTTVEILNAEITRLRQIQDLEKKDVLMRYDSKLTAVSKTMNSSFESEVTRLQSELVAKLEEEKRTQLTHQQQLISVHHYFESRWGHEMKKVRDYQAEQLRKSKIENEALFEEKFNKAKEKYAQMIAEERQLEQQRYKEQIKQLQEKYEKEKMLLIEMKENEVKETTNVLEKKFNENLAEIQKNLDSSNQSKMSEEQAQRKWEKEKFKLIASHRKQLSTLKEELKCKYEKQLQAQSAAHNDEIAQLEETCKKKVEEVQDLIKEAKQAASKTGYSDSGSNRTTTPSSDMTSSDEACSSCQEDMLSVNKHILVDKIHQDGKRVLSLIESSAQPYASVKEAHLWLEERKWIVNRLKVVVTVISNGNLKAAINDLVDEVQKFRMNFETALEENSEWKEKCDDLEEKLSIQYSKLCDINAHLKEQKTTNLELESLLSLKTSELSDLKRKLSEASRLAQTATEKETSTPTNDSRGSSSYDIGCLRSADELKSAEKFSLFFPDIGSSPSLEMRTPVNKDMHTKGLPPLPKFEAPPLLPSQNNNSPDVIDTAGSEMLRVKEKLLDALNKNIDPIDGKLHGLYWVYRRSQSYNKALIYQKKYLLMLLRGFQQTEKVTLGWLKCMNSDNNSSSPGSDITVTDSPLYPKSRFRAAVFVIIALERMKFYVRRWRLLARIPSSQVISVEIQSVFQNYSFLSPVTSPGGYHLSSHSLSSVPVSLSGRECKSSQISTSSRAENKSKSTTNPDKSQLIEYVHRLEVLQKQLGLDNLR